MSHTNIIILFNTFDFLPKQIELLRKNVRGGIMVVDNSTDYAISRQVKRFCESEQVNYLKTSVNEADFSRSHSYACEIAYNMCESDALLYLDHDIFPFKEVDVTQYDNYLLCGNPQYRKGNRLYDNVEPVMFKYYWPGCLYVNKRALQGVEVDFRPCVAQETFLDTGGSLYKIIMGNQDRCLDFTERHEQDYAIINDSWLHVINGSNWKKDEAHRERIKRIMDTLEQKANV